MNKNSTYVLIALITVVLIGAGIVILGKQNNNTSTNQLQQSSSTTNNNQSSSNQKPVSASVSNNQNSSTQINESTDEGGTAEESGRCVIKVLGNRYDVTELQSTHPGGNVYICGTDMTDIYVSQHGRDTTQIAPYKL